MVTVISVLWVVFSAHHVVDCVPRYVECASQTCLRPAWWVGLEDVSDEFDLVLVKFGGVGSRRSQQPMSHGMASVVTHRAVFEVIESVVGLITVEVIDGRLVGSRAEEGFRDDGVNCF